MIVPTKWHSQCFVTAVDQLAAWGDSQAAAGKGECVAVLTVKSSLMDLKNLSFDYRLLGIEIAEYSPDLDEDKNRAVYS